MRFEKVEEEGSSEILGYFLGLRIVCEVVEYVGRFSWEVSFSFELEVRFFFIICGFWRILVFKGLFFFL